MPKTDDDGYQYRELTQEEIATLEPIFKAAGTGLPDPRSSNFVGAIKGGKVVGFLVLQAKIHAEPMWIEEGHSSIFSSLAKAAEDTIIKRVGAAWVYLFAPAGRITQLAQNMGMQLEPWCVLSKLVQQAAPVKTAVDLSPLEPQREVTKEELATYPVGEVQQ